MKEIKQELEVINNGMAAQVPVETLQAFGNSIADLATKEYGKTSEVGMTFADIAVRTIEGSQMSIRDMFEGKSILVSFVRGSWCPFCNVEMGHLLSYYEELQAKGVEVVVVSPMRTEALEAWKKEMNLPFSMAQDKDLELAKALGIDFELQDFVQPHYEALGINVKAINETERAELVIPAVYLIDENGVITFRFMDVNYGNRLDLKEVVELI